MTKSNNRSGHFFSLSFVDCIASSLGAIIVLNLLISVISNNRVDDRNDRRVTLDVELRALARQHQTNPPSARIKFYLRQVPDDAVAPQLVPVGDAPQTVEQFAAGSVQIRRFGDIGQGAATLWLEDLPPGTWELAVFLESDLPPHNDTSEADVVVNLRVGRSPQHQATRRLALTRFRKLAFESEFPGLPEARGDFLRFSILKAGEK